ncbi:MAG: HD-GYP domain-containing protein [Actinobacteria bacterium]|nr:MAG: HD-GYP domain-containing protein [Actinomycetota bacterium]
MNHDELPAQPVIATTSAGSDACDFALLFATLDAFALALVHRDPETVRHQRHVGALAEEIGTAMGLPAERCKGLRIAGEMHDIGKWAVPEELLDKPGPLSDSEFEVVKCHSTTGYEALSHVSFPWPVAEAVHQHHERLDGSGYPRHLKGNEICLEARVIAVADVLDAIANDRAYRRGAGYDAALRHLSENAGTAYDSQVVEACIAVFGGAGLS